MRLNSIKGHLAKTNATLIAVSKTKSTDEILEIYKKGLLDFGENKVQELVDKQAKLPQDIRWHMIGHLQKNKVKYIIPFVHLIHAVDSRGLLELIDKSARNNNRLIDVLLQYKIAEESTKFGLDHDGICELIELFSRGKFPNVRICGLMGMASFTDNSEQINREFASLHDLFIDLKELYLPRAYYFKELSMGMSQDYEIALEHGATMVRIGSLIFGER